MTKAFSPSCVTYHPHCQPAPGVGGRCWAVWSGPAWSQLSGHLGGGDDGWQPASAPQPDRRPLQGSAGVCSSAGPHCSLEVWGEEAWGGDLLAHLLLRLWCRDPPEPDPGSLEGWEGEHGNAHPWRGRWHSTLDGGVDQKKGGMVQRRRGVRDEEWWGVKELSEKGGLWGVVWWGEKQKKIMEKLNQCDVSRPQYTTIHAPKRVEN